MKWTRTRMASAVAMGTASTVLLAACTGNATEPTSTDVVKEDVTLTVAYWGDFGLESLVSQYEADNPHVTIELNSGDYTAQHDALSQALIAGTGAAEISFVDEGFITRMVSHAEEFVNLLDLGAEKYEDNYLPWKWAQASNADGSALIGLGVDVSGLALCYRHDLFEEAGLPADRDAVDELIGDTWDGFIEVGKMYKDATGKTFIDNAMHINAPALAQLGVGYYNRNDELDMEATKGAFDAALGAIDAGISANLTRWTPEWNAGFTNGDFAVLPCPVWVMGHIQRQISADEFTGQWDVADIPGPGGNWGGAFYTIPAQFDDYTTQEAYNFVEWMIQADRQLAIFQKVGKLPSQEALYADPSIQDFSNEFFNNAPVGAILAKTVADIPAPVYHAPKHNTINNAVETVLNDVQNGNVAIADAWDTAVAAAEAADRAG